MWGESLRYGFFEYGRPDQFHLGKEWITFTDVDPDHSTKQIPYEKVLCIDNDTKELWKVGQ